MIPVLSAHSQDVLTPNDRQQAENAVRILVDASRFIDWGKFSWGFHLSPSISWLNVSHNDLRTDGATITGELGISGNYDLSKRFSLVTGLNLGIQGGYVFDSLSLNDLSTRNNFLINYYTLELPIMLRVSTLPVNRLSYYAQAGVTPGIMLGAREYHKRSAPNFSDKKSDIFDRSNPAFVSLQVGFGTKLNVFRSIAIFAEVNYKSSLVNMASDTGYRAAMIYTDQSVPNIVAGNMLFSVGVLF